MVKTKQDRLIDKGIDQFQLHSATAELHDRVCGQQGAFQCLFESVKADIAQKKPFCITIPVSRYNFFCVGEIVTFAFSVAEKQVAHLEPFTLFPVQTLCARYERYIAEIQNEIRFQTTVALTLGDDRLLTLLREVQESVRTQPEREYQIIRLFSLLCEKTFIGPERIVVELPALTDDSMRAQEDELLRFIKEVDRMHTSEIVLSCVKPDLRFGKTIEKIRKYIEASKSGVSVSTCLDCDGSNVEDSVPENNTNLEACFTGYFFAAITKEQNVVFCSPNRKVHSLKDASFRDIWFSPEYERFRRQAKYLQYNKDVVFGNGETLYGTDCLQSQYCQKTREVQQELDSLGWRQYLEF